MNKAERIFRSFFKNLKEYRDFKKKYNVNIVNHDFEGDAGGQVDVLADNGYAKSFEDKPAFVSLTQYERGSNFSVGWLEHQHVDEEVKLVYQRENDQHPVSYSYKYLDRLLIESYYHNGIFVRYEFKKLKMNEISLH